MRDKAKIAEYIVTYHPESKPYISKQDEDRSHFNIVYYINAHVHSRYIELIKHQMIDLKKSSLLKRPETRLHIMSAGSLNDRENISRLCSSIFPLGTPWEQHHTEENLYEYPGIKLVHQLSHEMAEDGLYGYIGYFHAKGLSMLPDTGKVHYDGVSKRLFRRVFRPWRKNLLLLENMPEIDKLGYGVGGTGWLWYNFWIARSSWIQSLPEPQIETNRHNYEAWIGKSPRSSTKNTLSVIDDPKRGFYHYGTILDSAEVSTLLQEDSHPIKRWLSRFLPKH